MRWDQILGEWQNAMVLVRMNFTFRADAWNISFH